MVSVERYARAIRGLDLRVLGAYAAIYFLWGANFLAVRYAVASIPPLLTIAVRSLIAGALLFGWAFLRTGARPRPKDWRDAAVGGLCFFGLCHGLMAWAAQYIPSGLSAVILALIPAWVAVLSWLRPGGSRPSGLTALGLLLSFVGVVALVLPDLAGGTSPSALAAALLVFSALAWAAGSVYSSAVATGVSPIAMSGMQLLCGGAIVLAGSLITGEAAGFSVQAVDLRGWLALAYLIVIGSLLCFSAYVWLLRVSSPARVATYAYVNPVVAVALGWAVAGELLTLRHLAMSLLIILGVVLIITARQRPA